MFLDQVTIAILFRLINFSLFLGLIVYAYKKYLLPSVSEQIMETEEAKAHLQHKAQALIGDMRQVDQMIEHDKQFCQALKVRVVEWRGRAERIAHERTIEQQEHVEAVTHTIRSQTQYLHRKQAFEHMLPDVIAQMQKKLEQKFEDEKVGQQFIAQLIGFMEKDGCDGK